jgi:hypothetical protein
MRRQQLTEAQLAALFDPPTDRRELVRHCTLSEADTAMIRRCRGDHSRLGYALMLCYLRYPGRPLRINERAPAALISFVAEQIDVRPESIDDYLISGQNRRRHAAELQDRLRLRPFGRRPASELASSLLPHAMESDRLVVLAGLVIQECRQRGIVVPSPRSLERLCVDLRHQARREIERRLTGGLLAEQRRRLDALTERRAEKRSKLARLAAPDTGSDKACRDPGFDRAFEPCSRDRHRFHPRTSRASGPPCPARPRGRSHHGTAYRRLRTFNAVMRPWSLSRST